MKKNYYIYSSILIVGLILGLLIGYLYFSTNMSNMKIKWKIRGQELEIDLSKDMESYETMINRLFSKDFSKVGFLDWLKKAHRVYIYHDLEIINEISKFKPNDEISKRLIELEMKRLGPWSYLIDTVSIGVPKSQNQPKVGFANVCASSDFRGCRIKLYCPTTKEEITVLCTGYFICAQELETPDIQLNWQDAKKLFGYDNFRKYESAVAVAVDK